MTTSYDSSYDHHLHWLTIQVLNLSRKITDLEQRLSSVQETHRATRQEENPPTSIAVKRTTMSVQNSQNTRQIGDPDGQKVNGVPRSVDTQDVLGTDQRPKTPVSIPERTPKSPSNEDSDQNTPSFSAPTGPRQGHSNGTSKTCPFASLQQGHVGDSPRTWSPYGSITPRPESLPNLSDHQEQVVEDPITAESLHAEASSPPPSVNSSVSKCPIRFLDQHSPEEVAEYFEHHKHEIPRSHEVCVRRYQSNAESIRQLDAKYGNFVSMIQGLGMKHQPILAHKEEEDVFLMERNPMEKVRNWANGIKDASEEAKTTLAEVQSEPDSREGLFDRPYKEVRVGESPTRPWGISVPFVKRQALSTTSAKGVKGNIAVAEDISKQTPKNPSSSKIATEEDNSASAGKCFCPRPICMDAPENGFATLEQLALHILDNHKWPTQREESSETKAPMLDSPRSPSPTSQVRSELPVPLVPPSASSRSAQEPPVAGAAAAAAAAAVREEKTPQMLFTGPVFIGYPADQVSTILQHCGGLGGANQWSKP